MRHQTLSSWQLALPNLLRCARKSHESVTCPSTWSMSVLSALILIDPLFFGDLPNTVLTIVQAHPHNAHAMDPSSVTHHLQRVGYHFRTEVVEDCCETLGYVPYRGGFVKQSELEQRNKDSTLGKILQRFGVQYASKDKKESPELVRAYITELFPRIPEGDLNYIVNHAWAEGTGRVGSAKNLDLPRRVQLATIARIRHKYTDYDLLLNSRAFEWADARREVEPFCLRKLVEWRGENDAEDGELEEIVRETIVIDDDDDDGRNPFAAEGDDSDDNGIVSDTSVEISHRPAAADDLRAEDAHEHGHRYLQRFQPARRNLNEARHVARAKLGAIRNTGNYEPQHAQDRRPAPLEGTIAHPIFIPPRDRHNPPDEIVLDGQILRRVSAWSYEDVFEGH
jgi:hypothetical protein